VAQLFALGTVDAHTMTSYLAAIIVSAVIVVFEVWNIRQAKRSGCVYLGLLLTMKRKENKNFEVALIGNIVWTILLLIFILYCSMRLFGFSI
jgi:hypothetical protein